MKLSLIDIFSIKAACENLLRYNKINKNGEITTVPFDFTGKTRWDNGKNLGICQKAFDKWQKDIILPLKEELKIDSNTKPDDPILRELNSRALKHAEEIIEDYSLVQLPKLELIDDKNPVSSDVLMILDKYELLEP